MQRPADLLLTVVLRPEGSPLPLGQSYSVDRALRIGRAGGAALSLPDRTVSRDHAELWPEAGAWWIRNRAAANGLFVDGRALAAGAAAPLPDGARLQIGGVVLAVQHLLATQPWTEALSPEPVPGAPRPPGAPAPAPLPRFIIRRDGDACTVHYQDRLLDLPPAAASVLAALAERPGEVIHRWDLLDAGPARNLPQAVSAIRRALRQLAAAGSLDLGALARAAGLDPNLDQADLLRRLVFARRRHGYGLAVPASWLSVEDLG